MAAENKTQFSAWVDKESKDDITLMVKLVGHGASFAVNDGKLTDIIKWGTFLSKSIEKADKASKKGE